MKKGLYLIFGLILLFSLVSVSAYDTHQVNMSYEIVVSSNNATQCNLSYIQYGDGSKTILNNIMTKSGTTFYQNITYGNLTRQEVVCAGISCTDGTTFETGSKCLDLTLSGKNPDSSNGYTSLSFLLLLFGIAGIFLFLAFKVQSAGVKIFFIMASFVFLIGSLAISYLIAFESNMTIGINNTIKAMMYAFGLIMFTIFAYILINQIKEAVNSFRESKGYEVEF